MYLCFWPLWPSFFLTFEFLCQFSACQANIVDWHNSRGYLFYFFNLFFLVKFWNLWILWRLEGVLKSFWPLWPSFFLTFEFLSQFLACRANSRNWHESLTFEFLCQYLACQAKIVDWHESGGYVSIFFCIFSW